MKKRTITRIAFILLLFIIASAHIWIQVIYDYTHFLALTQGVENIENRESEILYIAVRKIIDGKMPVKTEVETEEEYRNGGYSLGLRLEEKEIYAIYNIIAKVNNPHLIWKRSPPEITTCIYMNGSLVDFTKLYPDYMKIGKYIYATSDNYPKVYEELQSYLMTLDPKTHIPDRPIF